MAIQEDILEIVGLIYTAAGDPQHWTFVLERISRLFQGVSAIVHYQDLESHGTRGVSAVWNIDPFHIQRYASYYTYCNPWLNTRPELFREGAVYPGQVLCPDEIMYRSEYYNDLLLRIGVSDGLGVTVLKSGSICAQLSILRPIGGARFDETDCKLMGTLLPHLRRAFQLHSRIQELESRSQTAAEALDQLPTGVVLLDMLGRAVLVNRATTDILAADVTLTITSSGLVATISSENRKLNGLIRGAIAASTGKGLQSGGVMTISRKRAPHPLHILVTPLKTKTIFLENNVPVAAVFISDPDRNSGLGSAGLSQLYGLTPAETRIARALAQGKSLRQTSEDFGVAISTVRSQLKSIFSKTGASRQSELVKILLF